MLASDVMTAFSSTSRVTTSLAPRHETVILMKLFIVAGLWLLLVMALFAVVSEAIDYKPMIAGLESMAEKIPQVAPAAKACAQKMRQKSSPTQEKIACLKDVKNQILKLKG